MANESHHWAYKELRQEDMEAWTFKLFLEYIFVFFFSMLMVIIDDRLELLNCQP
jgi:hypothetical protein